MRATYKDGEGSFIIQEEDSEMGQIADTNLGRAHPPYLLAELLANGGGIWKPMSDSDEQPDLNRLAETSYFDRAKNAPTVTPPVGGDDSASMGSDGPPSPTTYVRRGATFEGAPQ